MRSPIPPLIKTVFWSWIASFVVTILIVLLMTWGTAQSNQNAASWAFDRLNETEADQREQTVEHLKRYVRVGIAWVPDAPDHRAIARQGWLKIVVTKPFHDGQGGLRIGPFNPLNPYGQIPIGLVLLFAVVPIVASVVSWRFSRDLALIRLANDALSKGALEERLSPTHPVSQSFNQMAKQIGEFVSERDELIQAVSHEICGPVSRARLHLKLLEHGHDSDAALRLIDRELQELDGLADDMAQYLRSGETEAMTDVDIDHVISQSVSYLQEIHPNHEFGYVSQGPLILRGAGRSLARVVDNILSNSVRFSNSTTIELDVVDSLSETNQIESVRIRFDDDGVGVEEANRSQIFEPFFQESKSRNDGGQFGLGLAICKRVVERHGGISLASRSPRGGLRIELLIPRVGGSSTSI